MFNTFLTNILNSYLGELVEDLDVDNLGVGALNGDILLIDLKLRPDALVWFKNLIILYLRYVCQAFLELPIEVKYGSIGKLSLKIPWTSLNTSPVVVTVQVKKLSAGKLAEESSKKLSHFPPMSMDYVKERA